MFTRRLFAALVALLLPTTLLAAEPFRFPEAKYKDSGELKYRNGIPVLTVAGTPEEMGEAVGVLALKSAAKVLDYPRGLLEYFSAGPLWTPALKQGHAMFKQCPEDYKKELEAMVKGAGADRDKVIAGNTLFDIKKMILCSALGVEADRSITRGPLLGRNLDYPSLGYVQEYTLVTIYRPKGKHAFVSIGFPGIIGVLSGMNDAGLSVGVLEVFAAKEGEGKFSFKGIPYAMCYRALLEECTTIEEAKKKLESMPRTTLTNLAVADKNGVAVFEISPKSVVMRKSDKGIVSCTNHFCSEIKPGKPFNLGDSFERMDVLEGSRTWKERLSLEDIRGKLDAVNLGDLTLQTMIFEPATLTLHLAFGEAPASRLKFKTIGLAELFKPVKPTGPR